MLQELRGDLARHGGSIKNPSLWALCAYRFGRWSQDRRWGPARWLTSKLYGAQLLVLQLAAGITIPRDAEIGEDLHLIHGWNIKIHPATVIGDRCGIMHDVTLGTSNDRPGAPRIGDDVFIGAGAKVLGPVEIGDAARIAANSLVLSDVPAGAVAIGVPARVIRYTGRPGTS